MKPASAHQCILAGVILVVFIFISSVHYFSQSFVEFRKKIGFLDFTGAVEGTLKVDSNETILATVRPTVEAKRVYQEQIDVVEILPNCGLSQQCRDDSFAVHIFTGNDKDDEPRLCVVGKYVIGAGVNNGGRGINAALVEPMHFRLVSVKNFDTYGKDSTELEAWIENEILMNDIVIFFTFDEASKELSNYAKKLLFELGSYRVQDLHFRSQWYMISQRGIGGFTPFESLKFAKNNRWADAIDMRLCVPRHIGGEVVAPDPLPTENIKREMFCHLYNGTEYVDFCEASAQREPLSAAMLTNRSLIGNLVYSAPVLLLAGPGRAGVEALLLTLDSLAAQPGLSPGLVLVLHHDRDPEPAALPAPAALAALYGFQSARVRANISHAELLECGLELLKQKFPDKKYVIVIEEDLILSPDFLFFMAQMILILEKDNTLLGISAWNPNGFEGVTSDPHLAYRVEEFPGAGFLIPMLVYNKYIEGKFNVCCSKMRFFSWTDIVRESGGHIIVPDVSRVLYAPEASDDNSTDLFLSVARTTNVDAAAYINRPQDLEDGRYFQTIAKLVQESISLHMTIEDLTHCRLGTNLMTSKIMQEYLNKTFVVYFKEDSKFPGHKLKQLAYCFGIPVSASLNIRGIYKNLLRLTVNHNTVLLIEAASPFFKTLPRTVQPL